MKHQVNVARRRKPVNPLPGKAVFRGTNITRGINIKGHKEGGRAMRSS